MKISILTIFAAFGLLCDVCNAVSDEVGKEANTADFTFADVPYFHRYVKDDLQEYTPNGQSDLNKWTDMVTQNVYRKATDGDGLAGVAESVLANYKANNGAIVKTDSVPRTNEKPAEHLIVVIFATPDFFEVAFTRFLLRDGTGMSLVYSHRIYGKQAGDEMKAWVQKNGPTMEKNLMKWDAIPKIPAKD